MKGSPVMTDAEKNIVKQMKRILLELGYFKAVYEGIVKSRIPDWRQQVDAANAAPEFQAMRQVIDEAREAIDLLIDSGEMVGAMAKMPGGLVN